MNIRKLFSIGALAAILAILTVSSAVYAAPEVTTTYTVNSTADEPDANLNIPACKSASGKCTLRAAIMQGNKQGGNIVINVPPAIYILLHSGLAEDQAKTGDLDVYGNVTIQGVGGSPVIDGFLRDRVFDLQQNSKVLLKNLTIQNGYVQFEDGQEPDTDGGGIRVRGTATLTNVQVLHNFAEQGGGIANIGSLTLINSTISNNHGRGGGIYNRYWNHYFAAELHMYYSTVSNNDAGTPLAGDIYPGEGGGILNEGAKLWVSNSSLYNNHAGYGGALANTYAGQVYLVNSTLSTNKSEFDGGAIHNFNAEAPHNATVTLSNVTIVGNRAAKSLEKGKGGGIYTSSGDTVTVRNSIVAKNQRSITSNYILADDCAGSLTSNGYNLIGSNLGCTGFVNGWNGDRVGTLVVPVDPKLGALASNGGPTKTYAPLPSSPAIDNGNWGGCRDQTGTILTVDQRGYVRPVDGDKSGTAQCDIGAFEYGAY